MRKIVILSALLLSTTLHAAVMTSTIYSTDGKQNLGQITFEDSEYGLMIKPQLHSLPPGIHGFHLHQKADCGDKGMNAGSHYDPHKTNSHQGPYGKGHLGDLPALAVGADGKATTPLVAPRLKTSDLAGLAVMIHQGGDTYSDNPEMGGGGARIGCGTL